MNRLHRPSDLAPSVLLLAFMLGCTTNSPVVLKVSQRPLVKVRTVTAIAQDVVRTTTQPASIKAFYETQIRSKISGYVLEVNADIGDVVVAGQQLAKIFVPELEKRTETLSAKIKLLESKEAEARAGVQLAEARVESQEAQLAQIGSELEAQDAILKAATAEFNRTQDLVQRGTLQQRLMDEATKKLESAEANLAAVKSSVDSAQAETLVAEAQAKAANAAFSTATAETQVARKELEELLAMLQYSVIKAPFAGQITERFVSLGDLVDSDMPPGKPLYVLSQTDKVRVEIPIPETEAPFVQPGDRLSIVFPSFASEPPLEAQISRVSGNLKHSTRTLHAEAVVANEAGRLLPGMFGQATLELQTNTATTMLPSRAVRFDAEGNAFVYLLTDQNQVQLTQVTLGMDTGTELEILAGVTAGQTVIGPHLDRFTDGQQVVPL